MKQKRVLILGGISIQIPMIRKAKEMGLYVITCDNRPNNPGHLLADEYHNISITDRDAVLALAKEKEVDAVVNYILEPGVQSAAYAQEMMGKPTSPYESVRILSNKQLFRSFLKEHGFSVPVVYKATDAIEYPVIVKPADLWGSRGCTRVDREEDLQRAIDYAMDNSLKGEIIIEQFIEAWHSPVEGDGFAVDGKLTVNVWGDCYPDKDAPNPDTPITYIFPSEKPRELMEKMNSELQRLITLLGMRTNAYNVEARFNDKGDVYLMEVAPRNGGNALTDLATLASGKDIMEGTLLAALGEDCSGITDEPCKGYWVNYLVHSNNGGMYLGMDFTEAFLEDNLVMWDEYLCPGETVMPYTGTNHTIGMLIARCSSREQQHEIMEYPERFFKLKIEAAPLDPPS